MAKDLAQLMMNFNLHCALCIQKLYHRLHFTVGGCWNKSPIFNRCSDATVRTREVLLVHASRDVITLSSTCSCFMQYSSVGRMGNLLCGRPLYYVLDIQHRDCCICLNTAMNFQTSSEQFISGFHILTNSTNFWNASMV